MTKCRAFLALAFQPAFILVALVLGLLGMHVLGVDHQVPKVAHSSSVAVDAQDNGTGYSQPTSAWPVVAHHIPVEDSPASLMGDSLGGMESALIGMCVLALSLGGIFFHLVSRAFQPVPGRGLAAPPALWLPRIRSRVTPSLVQLSISRT